MPSIEDIASSPNDVLIIRHLQEMVKEQRPLEDFTKLYESLGEARPSDKLGNRITEHDIRAVDAITSQALWKAERAMDALAKEAASIGMTDVLWGNCLGALVELYCKARLMKMWFDDNTHFPDNVKRVWEDLQDHDYEAQEFPNIVKAITPTREDGTSKTVQEIFDEIDNCITLVRI